MPGPQGGALILQLRDSVDLVAEGQWSVDVVAKSDF